MKKFFLSSIVFFLLINYSFSQEEPGCSIGNREIMICNNTTHNIIVQLYPVSVTFCDRGYFNLLNGKGYNQTTNWGGSWQHNFINGIGVPYDNDGNDNFNEPEYYRELSPGNSAAWEVDDKDAINGIDNGAYGIFGFGTYKLEIIHILPYPAMPPWDRDSLLIDLDYHDPQNPTSRGDLIIKIYDKNNPPPPPEPGYFYYLFKLGPNWPQQNVEVGINYEHKYCYTARAWRPNGPNSDVNLRPKNMGMPSYGDNFILQREGSPVAYFWYNFPLDVRANCNLRTPSIEPYLFSPYTYQQHKFPLNDYDLNGWGPNAKETRQGRLSLNLLVDQHNSGPWGAPISSSSSYPWQGDFDYCYYVIPLEIDSGARLTFSTDNDNWVSYELNNNVSTQLDPNFLMINKSYGKLVLDNNSQIIAKSGTKIIFEQGSYVTANSRNPNWQVNNKPHIEVSGYASLCNLGANIQGRLWTRYIGRYRWQQLLCDPQINDVITFNDSSIIQLSDSAEFEIPNNTSLIFDGPNTSLIMDSTSSIVFGNNAKLIVRNGANINAYRSKFTSLTSGSVWDGIYLEDVSNDILKNCVIENSMAGINVKDKLKDEGIDTTLASVEISDCQFINSTTTQLVTGIYLSNCNNALIRNNSFSSTSISNGFASAISIEYCPSGNIDIIDNALNYSLIGISIIQSSPYIARNTITGQLNSYYGIFLDNSSGIIRNNSINNFENSVCTYYSSPYLLKNNFSNANDNILEFHSNSAPIMKPIVSGSSLYWYSGNNYITGTPSYAGIEMNNSSAPEIDGGYNIIAVNGSSYLSGAVPDYMDGTYYVTYNNWQDQIPIITYFDVDSGTVEYEPVYDGVSVPGYDSYDLNSIGFGLVDTVFIKDLGDVNGVETAYLQAYKKEIQKQYSDAINLYKDVLRDNKKSPYALSSLFRILNCYEKNTSNNNHYTALQNYLNQIKNNNSYSLAIRDIAEDLIIKIKVKLGLINNAIQDYTSMYQQNPNSNKGLHALINKEYLLTIQCGDNNSSYNSLMSHKLNLLSLITSDNSLLNKAKQTSNIPGDFILNSNYPNPFNPSTNIKYGLPKKAFVNIKVFDITGREIITLVNEYKDAGYHTVLFNGYSYSSGVYFYKMEVAGKVLVGKMLLIK